MTFEDAHADLIAASALDPAEDRPTVEGVKTARDSATDGELLAAVRGPAALRSWKLWVPAAFLIASVVLLVVAPWKKGTEKHQDPTVKPQTIANTDLNPGTTRTVPKALVGIDAKGRTPGNGAPKGPTPNKTSNPPKGVNPPPSDPTLGQPKAPPPTKGNTSTVKTKPGGVGPIKTPTVPKNKPLVETTPPTPRPKLEVKTPETVELSIESVPRGATIFVDGKKRGRAPYTLTRPHDGTKTLDVKIVKRGYEPRTVKLSLARSGIYSYSLLRVKGRGKRKKKKTGGTGDRIFSP